jgi:hypothetical protein
MKFNSTGHRTHISLSPSTSVAAVRPRAEAPAAVEGLQGLYQPAIVPLDSADAKRREKVMRSLGEWAGVQPKKTGVYSVGDIELSIHHERQHEFECAYVPPPDGPEACDLEQAGLEPSTVVDFALNVLERSGQLAYLLRYRDHLMDDHYGVHVKVAFQDALNVKEARFHMDGNEDGTVLFTNLIHDIAAPIDGAEFIVNPPTLRGRIEALNGRIPDVVLGHLLDVHRSMPHEEVIRKTQLDAGDMCSFTNLTVYHSTPDPKSRGVDVDTLGTGLPEYFERIGRRNWSSDYRRYAALLVCEGIETPSEDDAEFMKMTEHTAVGLLARLIHTFKGAGKGTVYTADLVQTGFTPDDARGLLEHFGARPKDVVNVLENGRVVRHSLTDPLRTLPRQLSDTIRDRARKGSRAQPETRRFLAVLVILTPGEAPG